MSPKVVTFGEIMMRLSPPGYLRFGQARSFDLVYGGGEANVAAALADFGVPVDFVTRLPKNDIGRRLPAFRARAGRRRGQDRARRRPPGHLFPRDGRRGPGQQGHL